MKYLLSKLSPIYSPFVSCGVYCLFWIFQDELEAELEELEGVKLEEQVLQTATTAPAPPVQVPAVRLPTQPVPHKNTSDADEFAALQAEMAM